MSKYEKLKDEVAQAEASCSIECWDCSTTREEVEASLLYRESTRIALAAFESGTASMHEELTSMLKRILYGKWSVQEVEAIIKKAEAL